jgi:hypothetical protein
LAVSGVAEALVQPQFEQVLMSASDAVKLTNGKHSTITVAIREATAVMSRVMCACASASPPSAARSGSPESPGTWELVGICEDGALPNS